jgi:hypothetical protein
MVLKTKYNIGDKIWFVSHNMVNSGRIDAVSASVIKRISGVSSRVFYRIEGTLVEIDEKYAFESKEDLKNALFSE